MKEEENSLEEGGYLSLQVGVFGIKMKPLLAFGSASARASDRSPLIMLFVVALIALLPPSNQVPQDRQPREKAFQLQQLRSSAHHRHHVAEDLQQMAAAALVSAPSPSGANHPGKQRWCPTIVAHL